MNKIKNIHVYLDGLSINEVRNINQIKLKVTLTIQH